MPSRKRMITGKPPKWSRDLRGQRFGRLVAIRDVGSYKGRRHWECQCDCGNTIIVSSKSLLATKRNRRSCGCLKKDMFVVKPDSNLNIILHDYKYNATVRNLDWHLTREEARDLLSGKCYYCGTPPSNVKQVALGKPITWNGIDRKNPEKGYTLENCVSCCSVCNYMKNATPFNEFMQAICAIYRHRARHFEEPKWT